LQPHRWLRLRSVCGEDLLFPSGSPGSRKDSNRFVLASYAMQWYRPAGQRDGVERTLTTVLLQTTKGFDAQELDVMIYGVPEATLNRAEYVARQEPSSRIDREDLDAGVAAGQPTAAAWHAWKRLPVRRVERWKPPEQRPMQKP
jgi:hypothetical protein